MSLEIKYEVSFTLHIEIRSKITNNIWNEEMFWWKILNSVYYLTPIVAFEG